MYIYFWNFGTWIGLIRWRKHFIDIQIYTEVQEENLSAMPPHRANDIRHVAAYNSKINFFCVKKFFFNIKMSYFGGALVRN